MSKRNGILFVVVLFVLALGAGNVPVSAHNNNPQPTKVVVCHYDHGQGGKYTYNDVSVHSVNDANGLNGHGHHDNDAWKSFTFDGTTYPGQNEGVFGTVIDDNCNPVTPPTQPPTQEPTEEPTQPATATVEPTEPATEVPTEQPTQPATQQPTQPATQVVKATATAIPPQPPEAAKKGEDVCDVPNNDRFNGLTWHAYPVGGGNEYLWNKPEARIVKDGKITFLYEPQSADLTTFNVVINGVVQYQVKLTRDPKTYLLKCNWLPAPEVKAPGVPATGGGMPKAPDYGPLSLTVLFIVFAVLSVWWMSVNRRRTAQK